MPVTKIKQVLEVQSKDIPWNVLAVANNQHVTLFTLEKLVQIWSLAIRVQHDVK